MDDYEQLGTEHETLKEKGLFLAFIFFVIMFLFYATIGAGPDLKNVLYFYIMFGMSGLMFVVIDIVTKQRELEVVDTVTVEDGPIDLKWQLLIGLVLSGVIAWFISTTGQAFVSATPFGISFNMFESKLGNAIISGVVGGIMEVLVIFGVIYPTLHSLIHRFTGSIPLALTIAVIAGSLIFTGYHYFVYKYNEPALITVFIFGLVFQILPVLFTRSLVIPMMVHFTNNLLVLTMSITAFLVVL